MTMTIAAVMYSSVVSKPENTLAKSAKYPPGPVTYACRSPALAWAIERSCSTLGVSCCQPLPLELTLTGTTTCNAWPSLEGIGPRTLPVTSCTPANRCMSAATLARSAAVTGPPERSWTTSAGNTSLGVNRLARSTTWVDSAFFGSHEDASFFCALLSLPDSGPATTNTAIQKTRTAHLPQRPHGRAANRLALLMTPPQFAVATVRPRLMLPSPPTVTATCRWTRPREQKRMPYGLSRVNFHSLRAGQGLSGRHGRRASQSRR